MDDWRAVLVIVAASFIPTFAGLVVWLMGIYKLNPFIFLPAAAAAVFGLQAYVYTMFKYYKERRLKRLTVFAVALAIMLVTPYVVYAIVTPSWSFKVTTDKAVYKLGENITITTTITNNGYIAQSFATGNHTVFIRFYAEYRESGESWGDGSYFIGAPRLNGTEWTLGAGQSLTRVRVWNQTRWERQSDYSYRYVLISQTGSYRMHAMLDTDGYDTALPLRDYITIEITP